MLQVFRAHPQPQLGTVLKETVLATKIMFKKKSEIRIQQLGRASETGFSVTKSLGAKLNQILASQA